MNEYAGLDALDAATGGDFTFRLRGEVHYAPNPAALDWQDILVILGQEGVPVGPRMSMLERHVLFARWQAHYGLPPFAEARRLVYNVNRYQRTLENDLRIHARVSLGDLWRSRRWADLLNAIDFLPSHSHYGEAVANDPEHAEMLIKALADRAEQAPDGASEDSAAPPLHTWDPTVNMLANILDAVRGVQYAVVAVQHDGKGQAPKPPEPFQRPKTVLDRAKRNASYERKLAKHKALVSRMLPNKAE